MWSDVHLGYMTLHNNHWENSVINTEFKLEARPQDTIKYSSQPPHNRGEICPSRQCRRQCKIFASGVNFSRNNAIHNINENTKYILS